MATSFKILAGLFVLFLLLQLEAQPVINKQPGDQTVINGGVATFAVQVSGASPFSYQWRLNGTSLLMTDSGVITRVAGIGSQGFSGDGGPALLAKFQLQSGICVDKFGNIYIADEYNNRIRKVDTNGMITTVAGNGMVGYFGDGGLATNAILYLPCSIAVDTNCNLYIADQLNRRIRKVDTKGIITTVAGNGTGGFSGDGGLAVNAELGNLWGQDIAVDNIGNMFIADNGSGRVRKVNTNGIIYTVAGGGVGGDGGMATNAMITTLRGVAVDNHENLLIVDNSTIRKVDTNGIITTVMGSINVVGPNYADGMLATSARLAWPQGVAVDNSGNMFVQDDAHYIVVNTNGIISRVVSGTGVGGVQVDAYGNAFFSGGVISCCLPNSKGQILRMSGVNIGFAGQYTVVISNSFGSVTSSVANLSVIWPPGISGQPQSQTVLTGSKVVFSVMAVGSTPLYYQWQHSSTNVPGANQTAYTIINASINSSGDYRVIITNISGSITSSPATLTIGIKPTIINQPISQAVLSGSNATFNVDADGTPQLYYQWYFNGMQLTGEVSSSYIVFSSKTNNSGQYNVVITNYYGSVTSSTASLSVGFPPHIITQPQSSISMVNSSNSLTVVANGTLPLSHQWWKLTAHGSNAVATPLVVNGFVVGAYITGGGAGYMVSPQVLFFGGSGAGAAGTAVISNGMVIAINISNTGIGYTTPPTIQIAPPSNIVLTNQTNAILTFLGITYGSAGDYLVVLTNNFGSVTSSIASLTVVLPGYNQITILPLDTNMRLSFVGIPGSEYALDRSFSLVPVNWVPQVTNPADSNGNMIFTNTLDSTTNNFWRIRSVP